MSLRQTGYSKVGNENGVLTVIRCSTVNGWASSYVSLQRLAANFEIQRSRLDQNVPAEYRSGLMSVARRFRTARIISSVAFPHAGLPVGELRFLRKQGLQAYPRCEGNAQEFQTPSANEREWSGPRSVLPRHQQQGGINDARSQSTIRSRRLGQRRLPLQVWGLVVSDDVQSGASDYPGCVRRRRRDLVPIFFRRPTCAHHAIWMHI